MTGLKTQLELLVEMAKRPQILRAKPSVLSFLIRYLGKFAVKKTGGNLVIHSHLPAVNSRAYTRFIDEHLLGGCPGPSHAQIGITNACPQNCIYCYNKKRSGKPLSTPEILSAIEALKKLGVFWLGLTGGEPLLNKDIVQIVEKASDSCAVKLFTTGCTLSPALASQLKQAGLYSVAVSLDSRHEAEHDAVRKYPGAYKTALAGIRTFKEAGLHVSVSAVLSRQMIQQGGAEELLPFLEGLGVHEAWLSESKPTAEAFWDDEFVITDAQKQRLCALQDAYNRKKKMTVNYLGHFEHGGHFGCNAGRKMVYIDPFGELSPCVFIPMTFGNIRDRGIPEIWQEMSGRFPSEDDCFMNKNFGLLKKHYTGVSPLDRQTSHRILDEVKFGPLPEFMRLNGGKPC